MKVCAHRGAALHQMATPWALSRDGGVCRVSDPLLGHESLHFREEWFLQEWRPLGSKFPPRATLLIPEGTCSIGSGLLNTRKVYHWDREIACLRDVETHAVWGKLEQIFLEAGGWTGWPLESKCCRWRACGWLLCCPMSVPDPARGICAHGHTLPAGAGTPGHVYYSPSQPGWQLWHQGPSRQSLSWEMC